MQTAAEIINWLIVEGPKLERPANLLHAFSLVLRDAGLKVDRSTLGAPILHPIAQSSYVFWDIENGPKQRWFVYTNELLDALKASPIHPIYERGEPSSLHLDRPSERAAYPVGEDLWAEGFVQYEALPLQFSDGTFKVVTLATKAPSGFSEKDMSLVNDTLPALTLVFENLIARHTAKTLMETYVGKRAGLRVLDGEIARGDGSHIDAVIWFSDLRGFTSLAETRTENELLDILNDHFERVTDAIESHSGEVLKFIGDAVLAIFPHDIDLGDAIRRAESAAFQVQNSNKISDDYSFGIGLHLGSVFYGNVGGGNRLDFTVIGPSVNVASRISGLCGNLNRQILASSEVAQSSARTWTPLGAKHLKGIKEPLEVFTI